MSQSAYMKRTYLGIEINPQYINMFEAYLKSTIESGKKEYYSYMNTMDQVAFETTIQNLRALKYGRILLNNIEKDYGINDLKIYVQRTESSISSKIKVEYTFIGRQLDDEFYRMISTYTNREPEFMAKHPDCHLETQVDVSEMMGAEIYLYLEYKGNKMTARVAPTSKARNGDTVRVAFDPHKVHVFDVETEQTILN